MPIRNILELYFKFVLSVLVKYWLHKNGVTLLLNQYWLYIDITSFYSIQSILVKYQHIILQNLGNICGILSQYWLYNGVIQLYNTYPVLITCQHYFALYYLVNIGAIVALYHFTIFTQYFVNIYTIFSQYWSKVV